MTKGQVRFLLVTATLMVAWGFAYVNAVFPGIALLCLKRRCGAANVWTAIPFILTPIVVALAFGKHPLWRLDRLGAALATAGSGGLALLAWYVFSPAYPDNYQGLVFRSIFIIGLVGYVIAYF